MRYVSAIPKLSIAKLWALSTAMFCVVVIAGCSSDSGSSTAAPSTTPGSTVGGGNPQTASVSILSPPNASYVNAVTDKTVSFSGSCSYNNQTVFLVVGSLTFTPVCNKLGWSQVVDMSTLGDGASTAKVTHTSVGSQTATAQITVNKKAIAPNIAITSPAAGSAIPAGSMSAYVISGTCSEVGQTITATGDGTGTSACAVGGTFSIAVNFTAAANGSVTPVLTLTDIAGNSSTTSRSYGKNVAGGSPTLALTSPSATTWINGANKASFTVSGTCSENGQNVVITGAASATVACSSLAWTTNLNFTAASDGVATITLTHTNIGGTATSLTQSFNKNAAGPTINFLTPAASSYINAANQAAITVAGTCTVNGATLSFSGAVTSTTACTSGVFSATLNFSVPSDGALTLTASQTDVAGNTANKNLALNKLTVAPTMTQTTLANPYTSSTNIVTFGGACSNGVTIAVTGTDTATASCSAGTWTYATASQTTDASRSYTFTATDAAGNTTAATGNWVRNTTPPAVGFSLPLPGTAVNTSTGITISGNCTTSAGAVNLAGAGLASPASTACTANSFSQNITMTSGDGTKAITVSQTNANGTTTNSRSFQLLTVAPTVSITTPVTGTYTQASATLFGGCTNGLAVLISGPITGSPVSATCSSGSYTQTVVLTAPDGAKSISITQTDAAGNVGSTAAYSLNRLTATPLIAISTPVASASFTPVQATSVSFTGTCNTSGGTVTITGPNSFSTTTPCTSGTSFSKTLNLSALSLGAATLTASITDAAGNVGTTTVGITLLPPPAGIAFTSPAANTWITSANAASFPVQGTCYGVGNGGAITFTGATGSGTCTSLTWPSTNVNLTGASEGPVTLTANFTDGNSNTATATLALQKDTVAPTVPTLNAYASGVNSLTTLPSVSWSASTDATSGIHHYEIALGTSAGGTQTVNWTNVSTATSYQFTGLSLTNNTKYYISTRAIDNAGNTSLASQGAAITADTTAPTPISGLTYSSSYASVVATPPMSWTAATDVGGSGINHYEVAIGTTSGGTDILAFSSFGASNVGNNIASVQVTGLSLSAATYYASVRAVDNAGNISTVVNGAAWSALNCTPGTTIAYMTGGTLWTVPSCWNSSNNTVEVIGGGGSGSRGTTGAGYGAGGGGGAYSQVSNLNLTPGASISVSVGSGGAATSAADSYGNNGGDTYFNGASCAAATVCAKGGARGGTGAGGGGAGGAAASGVGTVKYSGGNGGSSPGTWAGGGGGGAGGPHGNGGNGGSAIGSHVGSAGGGGGGGGTSAATVSSANTAGGNSYTGAGGGAAGGGAGTAGGGGGGNLTTGGGAGGTGTEWDASHGSGGGGGGTYGGGAGGSGGLYGGGGGGGAGAPSSGAGAQGIIAISYTNGCAAQTISHCSVSAVSAGGSSGTCGGGYTGSCNYTCSGNSWTLSSNTCTLSACQNVKVYLTSGTTWNVPANVAQLCSVEAIGGGGGGSRGTSGANYGSGGGGGAYSAITNLPVTPSFTITYQVGTGGNGAGGNDAAGTAGTDSYFNGASCAGSSVCAKAGAGATNTGGAGGSTGSGIGTTLYAGGNGGSSPATWAGGGGGGAGGPHGNGGNGGSSTASYHTGSGGGGGGGGGYSAATASTVSTAGGNNYSGSGGGAVASAGTAGGGGGGNVSGNAGAGGAGTEWDSSHGSGGGGGGTYGSGAGGAGALYGGGGGGTAGGGTGAAGAGGQGIIVITY